jgi:hypothetical protein
MLSQTEIESRREARRVRLALAPVTTGDKVCGCCGASYSRDAFLGLARCASNLDGSPVDGMFWRNCSCGSTIVVGA